MSICTSLFHMWKKNKTVCDICRRAKRVNYEIVAVAREVTLFVQITQNGTAAHHYYDKKERKKETKKKRKKQRKKELSIWMCTCFFLLYLNWKS